MITSTKTIIIEVFDSDDKTTYIAQVVDNVIKRLTMKQVNESPVPILFRSLPIEVQSEIIAHL